MSYELDRILISEEDIQKRVRELAKEVLASIQSERLLVVAILKGSLYFLADLTRLLPPTCEIDFIQVSSYHGGKSSSGVVQIRKDLDQSIEGRDVLIVEDIVDSGITLQYLRKFLKTRKPKSVAVVSLLSKRQAKNIVLPLEFVGFEIPDEFVVGYGLDYGELYRGLPYIATLREV